jgi:hypothetical protein
VQSILPQLSHIEEGLNTHGLVDCIRESRTMWETVLVPGKGTCVNATMLMDSIDVEYSQSQQKREVEGDVFTYFCDFLQILGENSKCTSAEILKLF